MFDVFRSKRHDTGVSPVIECTPPAGTTWNLNEAGLVAKLIARLPSANAPKMDGVAVVVGSWTVRYDPTATDVDTIGAYDVEIEVTRANGKKVTFPTEGFLSWVIESDLNDV